MGDLDGESGLAHSRPPVDDHGPPAGEGDRAAVQVPLPAEDLPVPGRRRQGAVQDRPAGASQHGLVVGQDRPLELAQLRARLDAERVHEHPPRLLVGGERTTGVTGAVPGSEQLRPALLPERLLVDESQRHPLGLPGVIQREEGLHLELLDLEVEGRRPLRRDRGHHVASHGERRPTPELQCRLARAERTTGVLLEGRPSVRRVPGGDLGVGRPRARSQAVPRVGAFQRGGTTVDPEGAAHRAEVHVERGSGRGRRAVAPEELGQALLVHRLVGRRQGHEQLAGQTAERHRPRRRHDHERAEYPDHPQRCSRSGRGPQAHRTNLHHLLGTSVGRPPGSQPAGFVVGGRYAR